MENPATNFMIIGRILVVIASIFDFEWFFGNYKAQHFVKIFGRNGTRILYAIIGIVLIFAVFNMR